MPPLERSTTVELPMDRAEELWTEFVTQQVGAAEAQPKSSANGGSADPGAIHFADAGDDRTDVTIRIDPAGISDDDEPTLTVRLDSYLRRFKRFAEAAA
jgi:hypothetical protein